jgi:GTPase SAR1 family protein
MRARDNPFATNRVLRIRYALPDDDWHGLLTRLAQQRFRGAIVGPHGAGKTTLLEDLREQLEARGMPVVPLRLDTAKPSFARAELDACFATATPDHVICLDGAEQLTRVGWTLFERRARRARGLVITSHHAGRLPTLYTCATSEHLLDDIVSRLLTPALREQPAALPTSRELFVRHRGNLRDALREMYDWYAALPLA